MEEVATGNMGKFKIHSVCIHYRLLAFKVTNVDALPYLIITPWSYNYWNYGLARIKMTYL